MQQLIGVAAPPQQKQSGANEESPGYKRERMPKQSQSARTVTRRDQ
jgi:hypothetical protein